MFDALLLQVDLSPSPKPKSQMKDPTEIIIVLQRYIEGA